MDAVGLNIAFSSNNTVLPATAIIASMTAKFISIHNLFISIIIIFISVTVLSTQNEYIMPYLKVIIAGFAVRRTA
jgi:hypothetical protein